jgi:hypothetical protein
MPMPAGTRAHHFHKETLCDEASINALFGSYTSTRNARRIVMGLKLNF